MGGDGRVGNIQTSRVVRTYRASSVYCEKKRCHNELLHVARGRCVSAVHTLKHYVEQGQSERDEFIGRGIA